MFYRVLYYHFAIIIALGCLLFIPHATSFEASNLLSVENFHSFSTRLLTTCSSTCLNGGKCDDVTLKCVCKATYLGADCGEKGTSLSNDDSVNSKIAAKDWIYFYYTLDEDKEVKISLDYSISPIKAALIFSDTNYVLPPTSQESYAYMNSPETRSWQITLSGTEVKRHSGQNLVIGLYNPNNEVNNIKIKAATSGSNTLTIILIIIGVLSVILNIMGCIYFIKYKMRRELLAALREQAAREERTNFSHNVHTHFGNLRIQNWSENGPNGQNNPNRSQNVDLDASLTQEDLNMYFPQTQFESLKTPFAQAECPICLEEFKKDEICRQLYCEHIFHTRCIQFWLAKHKACPNCKKSMTRAAIGDYYAHHKKPDGEQEEEQKAINQPEEGEENNIVLDIGQALANLNGEEPEEEEKDNQPSKIFNEEGKVDTKEEQEEREKRLEATHLEVVHLSADKKDEEPDILENKDE